MLELKGSLKNIKNPISVIGLGYVGLPLAVEFSRVRSVIGYDIKSSRISELKNEIDSTLEVSSDDLTSKNLSFTNNLDEISRCKVFIVTVPTPIDDHNEPDLGPLIKATKQIGAILKKEDIVIYESTVFPGATEEICAPILEKASGLTINKDFFLGYSPERVNPGDKVHRIPDIVKVIAGSTTEAALVIEELYSSIILAGVYRAESIKVAEAAKVIENTQRDLNIALMNELSLIFDLMNIDTKSVLDAANTKWNFLNFQPGLVGGHCIGVDPYYLTHKSQSLGYDPKIILAGRNLNDQMSHHLTNKLIGKMKENSLAIKQSKILIMGLTFKENCPDIRNSKVIDIVNILQDEGINTDVYDPWVKEASVLIDKEINLINKPKFNFYDVIIIAVSHSLFLEMGIREIKKFGKEKSLIFDVKSMFPANQSDLRL
ncbi:nucleotide sugar dehydrogenase [Gammaproteobacteria bacterium]|nr:nucleotide sugar dehydrogenase [Gammaproteobacteria bacterium]